MMSIQARRRVSLYRGMSSGDPICTLLAEFAHIGETTPQGQHDQEASRVYQRIACHMEAESIAEIPFNVPRHLQRVVHVCDGRMNLLECLADRRWQAVEQPLPGQFLVGRATNFLLRCCPPPVVHPHVVPKRVFRQK